MNKMKIALLCDIDNVEINVDVFNGIIEKFGKSADIVCGKIYGYSDRRHKEFTEVINANCFEIAGTMRNKKRNSQTDIRLIIDAVELSCESYIDGFIIVAGAGDFAPLLAYLKGKGKFVAGAFVNPENALYCNETIELPVVEKIQKPKKPVVNKTAPVVETAIEDKAEKTDEPAQNSSDIFEELEKLVKEFAAKK